MRFIIELFQQQGDGASRSTLEQLEADNIETATTKLTQMLKSGMADSAIIYVGHVQLSAERRVDVKKLDNVNAGSAATPTLARPNSNPSHTP